MKQVPGGWEVSSVMRLTSGVPLLTPFYSSDPLGNYGFPGQKLPDLVGDPRSANQSPSNWINAAAFQDPNANAQSTKVYRYGDVPARMTQQREGATKNVDLGVGKGFTFTERLQGQFRAEFLNAFNHPIYTTNIMEAGGVRLVSVLIAALSGRSSVPATIRGIFSLASG